jgi:hypothetical protein
MCSSSVNATVVLDGIARIGSPVLAANRMIATDLSHAIGSPEVRHVTPDGRIRVGYVHGGQPQLRQWAERRGIKITEESVPGE